MENEKGSNSLYQEILYEVRDRIATVTLNRPERLNAWTLRMGAEVEHALKTADLDENVRVMVVTGAGRGYCAGADMGMLQSFQGGDSPEQTFSDLPPLPPTPEALELPEAFRGPYSYPASLRKPVIAAVNGIAAGLGFSYMLFYDLRIASDQARFASVFSRRGLVAEHGSSWLLPRLVGMHHAADLLFSGRTIDAQEALRIGLVGRVVPQAELMSTVFEVASEMANLCSPRSIRIMKRQLYGNLFSDLGSAMREADQEMVRSFGTEDFREGVASFVKRRPPEFTGR